MTEKPVLHPSEEDKAKAEAEYKESRLAEPQPVKAYVPPSKGPVETERVEGLTDVTCAHCLAPIVGRYRTAWDKRYHYPDTGYADCRAAWSKAVGIETLSAKGVPHEWAPGCCDRERHSMAHDGVWLDNVSAVLHCKPNLGPYTPLNPGPLCMHCGQALNPVASNNCPGTPPGVWQKAIVKWLRDGLTPEAEAERQAAVEAILNRAEAYEASRPASGPGRKDDGGKIRYSLLPWAAITEVVKVLEHGARKYAVDNWRKVPEARQRYADAAMRHKLAYESGEMLDSGPKGSGLPHKAHEACCNLFILALDLAEGKYGNQE